MKQQPVEYCELCSNILRTDEELVSGMCKSCLMKYRVTINGKGRKQRKKRYRDES